MKGGRGGEKIQFGLREKKRKRWPLAHLREAFCSWHTHLAGARKFSGIHKPPALERFRI